MNTSLEEVERLMVRVVELMRWDEPELPIVRAALGDLLMKARLALAIPMSSERKRRLRSVIRSAQEHADAIDAYRELYGPDVHTADGFNG